MKLRTSLPLLSSLLALAASPARAQDTAGTVTDPDATRQSRVDSIFRAHDRLDGPGCAVGVAQGGRTVLAKGYGMADLEHAVPISPRTVFYVGSVSKQFTAMSILLLAERGVLSLDDDVRKWVPELPDYGTPITIRHLLHHTSGLRDYLVLQSLVGHLSDAPMGEEAFLELVARQRGLNFEPGAEHRYSNTGYVLLSIVAKRATGTSLREVAQEGIFGPLGMTDTRFRDDHRELVPRRAHGYLPAGGGRWRLGTPMSDLVGGGGVFSTVLDLLKWGADFDDGRVGSRETRQRQVTVGTLRDGSALTYAAGLTIDTFAGIGFVEHGGSLAGYRAHFLRVPSERVAVAVTCNASTANAGALARAVTRLYLGGTAGQAVARADSVPLTPTRVSVTHRAVSLDSAALASYAGRYRSDELDATWTLAVSGDTLVLRRPHLAEVRLRPEEVDAFTFGSTTLRFTRAGSAVDGFTVHAGRAEGMRFERRP